MASNRPLFDDEELPLWLKNGGITHAGQQPSRPQQSNSSAPAPTSADDLSWLDGQPQAASAVFGDVTPNNSGVWLDDAPSTEATPAPSDDLPPWMQRAAQSASAE